MLSVAQQIAERRLVCPRTRRALIREGDELRTEDGQRRYPCVGEVPILLPDEEGRRATLEERGGAMRREYEGVRAPPTFRARLRRWLQTGSPHWSAASRAAQREAIGLRRPDELCLAIGGGGSGERDDPNLVNVNLDAFAGVDVVGDAYALPYADGSVDAISLSALLEHLEHPERAVAECFRVLKPGAPLFAATPFVYPFHAYPNHFQNFTLEGHARLFARAGFRVAESGVCIGPVYVLVEVAAVFSLTYLPWPLSAAGWAAAHLAGRLLKPLDALLTRRPEAAILAAVTYVHAVKPRESVSDGAPVR